MGAQSYSGVSPILPDRLDSMNDHTSRATFEATRVWHSENHQHDAKTMEPGDLH